MRGVIKIVKVRKLYGDSSDDWGLCQPLSEENGEITYLIVINYAHCKSKEEILTTLVHEIYHALFFNDVGERYAFKFEDIFYHCLSDRQKNRLALFLRKRFTTAKNLKRYLERCT